MSFDKDSVLGFLSVLGSLTFSEKLEISGVFFVDAGVLQIPVQELIQFPIAISLSLQVQIQVNEVTCTLQERECVWTASGCSELFVLLSPNRIQLLITFQKIIIIIRWECCQMELYFFRNVWTGFFLLFCSLHRCQDLSCAFLRCACLELLIIQCHRSQFIW